jgi:hypothetical protein
MERENCVAFLTKRLKRDQQAHYSKKRHYEEAYLAEATDIIITSV